MITRLFALLAIVIITVSCAAPQPTEPHKITMHIDGATQVVYVKPHPCEGNWNFCDQVMDDLDSFYIPAF